MELQSGIGRDDEFWRTHIKKAQEFAGSNQKYCEMNGLGKGTFYFHKSRLGFCKKTKPKRNGFVKVETVVEVPKKTERPVKRLPDPKWVAQFILALEGDR